MLDSTGPDHAKEFRARCSVPTLAVEACAEGPSRKLAETRAAERLLAILERDAALESTGDIPA